MFWPSHKLKQIPPQSDPHCSSCCEEKNMRFTRQPRDSSSSTIKVKITAPGLQVFLLFSSMDKAACLLLSSWLPRRHYMQDSFIVQRIQPQLLHTAWIASVKQRLLYLVYTRVVQQLSHSLSVVASQLSSSSCCGRSTCVTPWGRCRRRSTSLATWPSPFTTNSSCRRFSMSSGNSPDDSSLVYFRVVFEDRLNYSRC